MQRDVSVGSVERASLWCRRLTAWLFAALLVLGGGLLGAQPAAAAAGDEITSFDIKYVMQSSGVLHVQETIDYRFGSSGRHGIDRIFVTREKYDDSSDAVYGIDHLTVTSPDHVSTDVSTSTSEAQKGRETYFTARIGDANRTISTSDATYVISYDVTGAMRSFAGYDELYWDATGLDWDAAIRAVSISATVPGGAQGLTCTYGAARSTSTCVGPKITTSGVAQFSQGALPTHEGVTIGVKVRSGLVTDNKPHLEPDASRLSTGQKATIGAAAGAGILSVVLSPLLGVLWWRRNGRDQRYAGLPPGTVPAAGEATHIVPNDPDLPIPVAFSPPGIPVAEAGLLVDGQVDTRETAATIIDLAVRRAVTVKSSSDRDFSVALVDPGQATAPHETVLLETLFGGAPVGSVVDLSVQGSLQPAHQAMQAAVIEQVAARGWFTKIPPAKAAHGIGIGGVAVVAFILFQVGHALLWVLVPLLPVIVTVLVVRRKLRRGQRTADGRAVCDQVEGFKTYLATAEAEQLRFEEGEDIFSRYLPWAIAFDLADRWAKICGDLVSMGRLPDTTPYWYYGSYNMSAFNMGFLTGSLTSAATPAAPVGGGSSGTGFGGGSSFTGGGFSGGGGGGGGGGSW